ncbi:Putative RTA-like protein [Septoria linicola]|uniref:RTA-like protein n=1 Tax=Septoria linicola TaxID=215465 RepID=A0A9Q9ALW1_9PEZI|nr:putative RTA-like protein [Septoria linicola]USW51380.1 Putative RTA-like protein [Septoria linicola]
MASLEESCRSPYPYEPSIVLASVGIGLFAVLSGVHVLRMVTTRTWEDIFMILGGLCQTTGYVARAYSAQNVCSKAAYAAQNVLLLLGPSLLMFTVTLVHSSYIRALSAGDFSWVPLKFQKAIYLFINVACLVIQAAGGIEMSVAQSRGIAETGSKLKVAAFVIQMVLWGFILAENTTITIRVGRAVKRAGRIDLAATSSAGSSITAVRERFQNFKRWSQLFGLAISIIGSGRNLMRLTELGVGFLQNNEWPGYAFDGYQMVVVMGAWALFYLPGKLRNVERSQARYEHLDRYRSQDAQRDVAQKQVDGESTELHRMNSPRNMV